MSLCREPYSGNMKRQVARVTYVFREMTTPETGCIIVHVGLNTLVKVTDA